MPPPDPSQPDAITAQINNQIMQFLSDPLQFPDQFTSWLSDFTTINAPDAPTGATNTVPPTTP